jgi:hypothetical protein
MLIFDHKTRKARQILVDLSGYLSQGQTSIIDGSASSACDAL